MKIKKTLKVITAMGLAVVPLSTPLANELIIASELDSSKVLEDKAETTAENTDASIVVENANEQVSEGTTVVEPEADLEVESNPNTVVDTPIMESTVSDSTDLAVSEIVSETVEANGLDISTTFSDPKLQEVLKTAEYDQDENGYLSDSEIQQITYLTISGKGITNLSGIEKLTALKHLDASNNALTTANLSSFSGIEYIDLSNNQLTSVQLPSTASSLKHLDVSGNQLTSFTLPNNASALEFLGVAYNQLSTLNIQGFTKLGTGETNVTAMGNKLTNVTLPDNSGSINFKSLFADQVEAKDGYVFNWYKDGTTKIEDSELTNLPLDGQTLTGKQEAIEYTVKYDLQGGSGSTEEIKTKYDQDVSMPNKPTYEGHEFKGWLLPDGRVLQPGANVSNLTTVEGETVTVKAVWEKLPVKYELVLHNGDESNTVEGTIGEKVAYDKDLFTKEGYHLAGYDISEAATDAIYGNGGNVNLDSEDSLTDGKYHLYAVWENDAPVIDGEDVTLIQDDKFNLDDHVSVSDAEDKDITLEKVIKNANGEVVDAIDTSVPGEYTVELSATDKGGKTTTKTIKVTVLPKLTEINEAPVITANDVVINEGDEFDPLKYATATDKEDGSITLESKNIIENTVDTSKPGDYKVVYEVTDLQGAKTTKTIKVTVKENTAPVIKAEDITLTQGDKFNLDDHVSVSDAEDKDITLEKVIKNANGEVVDAIDTSVPGEYTVELSATDKGGKTTTKTIKVTVLLKATEINEAPVINANDVEINVGETFDPLKGVTATDPDGNSDLVKITVEGEVDTNKPGEYTLTYRAVDEKGAITIKIITVTVKANEQVTPDKPVEPGKPAEGNTGNSSTNNNSNANSGELTLVEVAESSDDNTVATGDNTGKSVFGMLASGLAAASLLFKKNRK